MIPASIHPVTIGASMPWIPVFGVIVSLEVFRVTERRVTGVALMPAHFLGIVGYSVMAMSICQPLPRDQHVMVDVLT